MGRSPVSRDPRALGEALRRSEEAMRVFLSQSGQVRDTTMSLCSEAVTPDEDEPAGPPRRLTRAERRKLGEQRRPLSQPCRIIPGTESKIARMEARVGVGLPPCVPGDLDLRHLNQQLLIDAVIRIQHYEVWSPEQGRLVRMAKLWAVRWQDGEKPQTAPVVIEEGPPEKGGAS
jgi:hypothetical protein